MRYGYTPYKEKCECTWCEEIENEKDKLVSQNNDEDESIKLDVPFEGRQLYTKWRWSYPNPTKVKSKTFYIKYDKKLSAVEKILLNNFRKKYFYHAVDDILYSLKSKPIEQDNLLNILYSPILSLQNNFSIDFFDIWIGEVYINEIPRVNKFLSTNIQNSEPSTYITLKLLYTKKVLTKKTESLW